MSARAGSLNRGHGALGLAVSAALHLVVIAFLAWSIRPTPVAPGAPPMEVSLWSFRPSPAPAAKHPRAGPAPATTTAHRPPAPTPSAGPSSPIPLPAPAPTDEAARAVDPVRALLRASVGCDHPATFHLTPAEIDQCGRRARRLGEDAPRFAARPHDDRKLAAFDQAARANDAERRAREGPLGHPIPLCAGPGSNFSGGCLSPHYKKGDQKTSEADQRSVWH